MAIIYDFYESSTLTCKKKTNEGIKYKVLFHTYKLISYILFKYKMMTNTSSTTIYSSQFLLWIWHMQLKPMKKYLSQ